MEVDPQRVTVDGKRFYRVGDRQFPSVTTVTGTYAPKTRKIAQWEEHLLAQGLDPDKERDRAALRGTAVHHRILAPLALRRLEPPPIDIRAVDDELLTDVETCVAMWEDLDFVVGPSPHVEEKVVNADEGYAGTFDLCTNGTLVDLKTSSSVYDSHRMQVAAYHRAVSRLDDYPDPVEAAIILLNPDPETNPSMEGTIDRMGPDAIDYWYSEFADLLDKFRPEG